jgi:hypothetical protein
MSLPNDCLTTHYVVEELFPGNPQQLIASELVDALQSHLTNGFEAALHDGMQPMDALAVILSWVSSEMMRTKPDQVRGLATYDTGSG